MELFAEISVFSALEKTLHYSVPHELKERARVGCRVLVPLGRREASGLILAVHRSLPEECEGLTIRPLRAVLDPFPMVPPDLIDLCRWIARYYFYPLGEVLQTALPPGLAITPGTFYRPTPFGLKVIESGMASELLTLIGQKGNISLTARTKGVASKGRLQEELEVLQKEGLIDRFFDIRSSSPGLKKVRYVTLLGHPDPHDRQRNRSQPDLMEILESAGGTLPIKTVRKNVRNADYWIRKFSRAGIVCLEDLEDAEDVDREVLPDAASPPELFPDQDSIIEALLPHVGQPGFKPFLLFGVTGSGKTEIYMRLVEGALMQGKGALVMVPEIALSTQMEALFRHRFGGDLAVWHSRLPASARQNLWREALNGVKKVILGVRSSVFVPIPDLGLIIVDEEHDLSYKQDDHLRYNARDVALMRARMLQIPILLGSATPSLQSIQNGLANRYTTLMLPKRVYDRPLPELQFVDMRRESGPNKVLSKALQTALVETVDRGQQALLFLNRRGFATFVLCHVCGRVLECSACSVSLTYHSRDSRLRCHYCGRERPVPELCPLCNQPSLLSLGFGTERVEEEVKRLLPGVSVVRLDRDTAMHPQHMTDCLNAMRHEKAKVLIGTQMIAKGHDFPNITLVGVVNADTALQIADFRAGETTVQLLMQVAGRAGRGDIPGRVILQTYNPSHYAIESVLKMDYQSFCEKELDSRRKLQYPPFTRFLKLLVTAREEEETRQAADLLAGLCRDVAEELRFLGQQVAVLGPSPAPLAKLKGRFRWHVFAKTWRSEDLQKFTETVLDRSKNHPRLRRVQLAIDRDPTMSL